MNRPFCDCKKTKVQNIPKQQYFSQQHIHQ
jgi:hypothetical protein